jgi:hypothetical protein
MGLPDQPVLLTPVHPHAAITKVELSVWDSP